jgi:hypothetical protein
VVVPDTELQCSALDRASEYVPAQVPLTRVLLGPDTACALRRLAEPGDYDLLVVRASLVARDRALRKEIRRLGLCTLTVTAQEDAVEHQR